MAWDQVLSYPEHFTYEPVGRCIYCGSDANADVLQKEHIIPLGLNGTVILPKASCAMCAKVTCALETFCLQRMLIDARLHLQLASRRHRRKKKKPPKLRVRLAGSDGETESWRELSRQDHPFFLCTASFPPAGFLLNIPTEPNPKCDIHLIPSPSAAERFSRLPANAWTSYQFNGNLYARMLAKIAHSFAVARMGYADLDAFLPPVILGRSTDIYRYVGGAIAVPGEAPKTLHVLKLSTEGGLAKVYIRLFAFMDAPAYEVVAGRRVKA